MRAFSFVVWLVVACIVSAAAQQEAPQYDSALVRFAKRNSAEVFLGSYNTNFNFHDHNKTETNYQLRVNRSAYIGVDMAYKWLYAQLSLNIPGTELARNTKFQYTQAKARFAVKKVFFQPFFRSYNGLLIPQGKHQGYNQFRGIYFLDAGLELYFYLNDKHFSARAAYAFSEKQRKPRGSFFLSSTTKLSRVRWSNPSRELISDKPTYELLAGNPQWISQILKLGYAYNFVYKDWLVAPTIFVGGGVLRELNTVSTSFKPVTEFQAAMNAGYNGDHYYAYVSGLIDSTNTHLLLKDMQYNRWTVSVTAGYRFHTLWRKRDRKEKND